MKKKSLLILLLLFSVLSLQAFPVEGRLNLSRGVSYLKYGEGCGVYVSDGLTAGVSYSARTWSAGAEFSLLYLNEVYPLNCFLDLGDLTGFSAYLGAGLRFGGIRASLSAGLAFYSIDLNPQNRAAYASFKASLAVETARISGASFLSGISACAEAGTSRFSVRTEFTLSVVIGGISGGTDEKGA